MSDISEEEKTIPFFPDHIKTEAVVAVVIVIIAIAVGILGQVNPIGMEDPADPMTTPAHTKPEWYFLFLYEVLKYVPKWVGSIIPFLGLLLLAFWPFLDRKQNSKVGKRNRTILVAITLAVILLLTVIGASS